MSKEDTVQVWSVVQPTSCFAVSLLGNPATSTLLRAAADWIDKHPEALVDGLAWGCGDEPGLGPCTWLTVSYSSDDEEHRP